MSGPALKFPPSIKPFMDAFRQAYVGLGAWQIPGLLDVQGASVALAEFERLGKGDAGLALSKELTGLPPGPAPNIAHSVRAALQPLIEGKQYHRLVTSLTQFLVGHCYAVMEEEGRLEPHRGDPVVQFLRHVRNGCFHGNRLNIEDPTVKGKKWREARWRGKAITPAMHGSRVFRANLEERDFFLNWGDAVLLVSDACALVYP